MSRSRKKTPITGNTGAPSEKDDKRLANRTLRRKSKEAIQKCEDPEDLLMPEQDETSSTWGFDKDGKHFFDPQKHPRLMRK